MPLHLLEVVVESKYKGGDCRSEDRPVGHAGSVALPLLQKVHRVEDQGQGDDVEDHVINQVPEKRNPYHFKVRSYKPTM